MKKYEVEEFPFNSFVPISSSNNHPIINSSSEILIYTFILLSGMCENCGYNCFGMTAKVLSPFMRWCRGLGNIMSHFSLTNAYQISQIKQYCGVGFQWFMRILGPIMLVIALGLITSILFTFLFFVVPDITEGNMYIFSLHFVGGMFILINVIFNYVACAFTPPGTPPQCNDPTAIMGQRMVTVDGKRVLQIRHAINIAPAISYRYCRHCKCIKPPRAHHDSVTGKCVLAMDHYCPWMNNCVGYNNYRHFVLFLMYLAVGCVYVLFVTTHYFRSVYPYQRLGSFKYSAVNSAILYSYTIGLSAGISVSLLGLWHLYLCLTNQTTIEFYINIEEKHDAKQRGALFKNPFDKGWKKNLMRVFGDVVWYHALAISFRKPPPDEWPALPHPGMMSARINVV